MERARLIIRALVSGEDGQGMAEYGVLLAAVSVAAISAVSALGLEIHSVWQSAADIIEAAM